MLYFNTNVGATLCKGIAKARRIERGGVLQKRVENSPESHKPVENQRFTSSDDPGRGGYLESNPTRKGR